MSDDTAERATALRKAYDLAKSGDYANCSEIIAALKADHPAVAAWLSEPRIAEAITAMCEATRSRR